jgi:hypothetical protein
LRTIKSHSFTEGDVFEGVKKFLLVAHCNFDQVGCTDCTISICIEESVGLFWFNNGGVYVSSGEV